RNLDPPVLLLGIALGGHRFEIPARALLTLHCREEPSRDFQLVVSCGEGIEDRADLKPLQGLAHVQDLVGDRQAGPIGLNVGGAAVDGGLQPADALPIGLALQLAFRLALSVDRGLQRQVRIRALIIERASGGFRFEARTSAAVKVGSSRASRSPACMLSPSVTSMARTIEVSSGCTTIVGTRETTLPGAVTTRSTGISSMASRHAARRPPITQTVPRATSGTFPA